MNLINLSNEGINLEWVKVVQIMIANYLEKPATDTRVTIYSWSTFVIRIVL